MGGKGEGKVEEAVEVEKLGTPAVGTCTATRQLLLLLLLLLQPGTR